MPAALTEIVGLLQNPRGARAATTLGRDKCHSTSAATNSPPSRWEAYNLTVQYSTVQYSAIRYSTAQYSKVQYSTVQYSTVQCSTIQYSTVPCSAVQYSTVQYGTVQYSTA